MFSDYSFSILVGDFDTPEIQQAKLYANYKIDAMPRGRYEDMGVKVEEFVSEALEADKALEEGRLFAKYGQVEGLVHLGLR
jgi:hypothetical protein